MTPGVIHVRIDDTVIAGDDPWKVLDPVLATIEISEGFEAYERSLSTFTMAQRLVAAVLLYRSEINNGGHDQFYFNSTGIVWRDALEGYDAMGLDAVSTLIRKSVERLGKDPSFDRYERQDQLDDSEADFDDLDSVFYMIEDKINLDAKIMGYIRSRPAEFYFEGDVPQGER